MSATVDVDVIVGDANNLPHFNEAQYTNMSAMKFYYNKLRFSYSSGVTHQCASCPFSTESKPTKTLTMGRHDLTLPCVPTAQPHCADCGTSTPYVHHALPLVAVSKNDPVAITGIDFDY